MTCANSAHLLDWRKSSYSGENGGNCIEVADATLGNILVRDSKDPHGPALAFDRDAWAAFVGFAAEREL